MLGSSWGNLVPNKSTWVAVHLEDIAKLEKQLHEAKRNQRQVNRTHFATQLLNSSAASASSAMDGDTTAFDDGSKVVRSVGDVRLLLPEEQKETPNNCSHKSILPLDASHIPPGRASRKISSQEHPRNRPTHSQQTVKRLIPTREVDVLSQDVNFRLKTKGLFDVGFQRSNGPGCSQDGARMEPRWSQDGIETPCFRGWNFCVNNSWS